MENRIIDSSDPGIVVKETMIRLSDEKLKGVLLRTYERAQKDMGKKKVRRYYSVFLSVAGTLFLSLITSNFGAIGTLSAECITTIAWTLCAGCAILGFVLMGLTVAEKTKNDTEERDVAVSEIFEQYLENN